MHSPAAGMGGGMPGGSNYPNVTSMPNAGFPTMLRKRSSEDMEEADRGSTGR